MLEPRHTFCKSTSMKLHTGSHMDHQQYPSRTSFWPLRSLSPFATATYLLGSDTVQLRSLRCSGTAICHSGNVHAISTFMPDLSISLLRSINFLTPLVCSQSNCSRTLSASARMAIFYCTRPYQIHVR